ncbi:hypothetical protein BU15DRAFT_62648 [Melanogaster broomeanus]|nr:hypothetical protein BU15DRAFT_62648 [Melanogaster broomeanus]
MFHILTVLSLEKYGTCFYSQQQHLDPPTDGHGKNSGHGRLAWALPFSSAITASSHFRWAESDDCWLKIVDRWWLAAEASQFQAVALKPTSSILNPTSREATSTGISPMDVGRRHENRTATRTTPILRAEGIAVFMQSIGTPSAHRQLDIPPVPTHRGSTPHEGTMWRHAACCLMSKEHDLTAGTYWAGRVELFPGYSTNLRGSAPGEEAFWGRTPCGLVFIKVAETVVAERGADAQ